MERLFPDPYRWPDLADPDSRRHGLEALERHQRPEAPAAVLADNGPAQESLFLRRGVGCHVHPGPGGLRKRSPLRTSSMGTLRRKASHSPHRSSLKRRKGLRHASSRRAVQLKEYARLKRDWIFSHPTCEICKAKPAAQVHHRCGRIGDRLNSTEDWLAVCADCHSKIHSHGSWAREQGFLK